MPMTIIYTTFKQNVPTREIAIVRQVYVCAEKALLEQRVIVWIVPEELQVNRQIPFVRGMDDVWIWRHWLQCELATERKHLSHMVTFQMILSRGIRIVCMVATAMKGMKALTVP